MEPLLNFALPERYDYGMLVNRTDVVAPLAGARHTESAGVRLINRITVVAPLAGARRR